MRAVVFHRAGPVDRADALADVERPDPVPGPRDLVVRVRAVSVNPVDVKIRGGAIPLGDGPHVLGYDAAGTVVATGAEATLFRPGDAVFYSGELKRPGTNSELHLVDERIVGPKPRALDWAAAAALPLTAITAWELLFDRLGVAEGGGAGDAILVVNGAGGVGSVLTQIARARTGLTVIATASRPETDRWCREMGAHHVVDHRQPLDAAIREIGIPSVRYVAGLTASDRHRDAIVASLAPQGHFALIDDPPSFDIVPFKTKSLSVHWELMFTRPLFRTADLGRQGEILRAVSALAEAGTIRTTMREHAGPIDAASLRRAHAMLETGRTIGKVVLGG